MDWKVIKELKERRAKTFNEANELRAKARKESRDLAADELEKHDKMLADVERMGQDIEREERAMALSSSLSENRSVGRDDSNNSLDMPEKDFKRYSILRALQSRMNGKPLTGIEAEVNAEMEKRTGRAAQGFYVPIDAGKYEKRTGTIDTTTGTGSVGITVDSSVIEILRNKLLVRSLGARVMADMQGKFSLPRQSGAGTAYWVSESGNVTASNQTLDQVAFVPKTVGAFTDISRAFINQTSIDAEAFVRDDLARTLAVELDRVAINGSGSGAEPKGILNTSGIGNGDLGTNGSATVSWAQIVKPETLVGTANADLGKLAYLTNSKVRGLLKTSDKTSGGYGQFIWESNNTINSYTAACSNNVPSTLTKGTASGTCSAAIFGNFDDLVIAMWGGLDVLIDPYTGGASGTLRVRILQDADVEVRHAASFAAIKDIIA